MAAGAVADLNVYSVFRFALGYPDVQHLEHFRRCGFKVPETLEDLHAIYLLTFEAGLPHPRCPLLESHYVRTKSAPQTVLENKMFYKNFGLEVKSQAPPDHLLTQLEFLAWLTHCIATGNSEAESLTRAREEFLALHVRNWLPAAVRLARRGGTCYGELLRMVAAEAGCQD